VNHEAGGGNEVNDEREEETGGGTGTEVSEGWEKGERAHIGPICRGDTLYPLLWGTCILAHQVVQFLGVTSSSLRDACRGRGQPSPVVKISRKFVGNFYKVIQLSKDFYQKRYINQLA
jgi:hypothetical protein